MAKVIMDSDWNLISVDDAVLTEAKKRKKRRQAKAANGYFVTHTMGFPCHDDKMFNKHMGTDIEDDAEEAAEAINAELEAGADTSTGAAADGTTGGEVAGGESTGGGEGGGLCEASNLSPYDKMKAFENGTRKENVKACGDAKLGEYHRICYGYNYANALAAIEAEFKRRGLPIPQYSFALGGWNPKATASTQTSSQPVTVDWDKIHLGLVDIVGGASNIPYEVYECEDKADPALIDKICRQVFMTPTGVLSVLLYCIAFRKTMLTAAARQILETRFGAKTEDIKRIINEVLDNKQLSGTLDNIIDEMPNRSAMVKGNKNTTDESLELDPETDKAVEAFAMQEAKRNTKRYYVRPLNRFCANKEDILHALADMEGENCSVYSLKNLTDHDDVHLLTTRDIIYYYDDGILYDKNHVKVLDYDLSVKKEEGRKRFSDIKNVSDATFDATYKDRLTEEDNDTEENEDSEELLTEQAFNLEYEPINMLGEKLDKPTFECCICGEEVEGYGNNPFPIHEEGRCCDACNIKFVLPARIEAIKANKIKEEE